MFALLRYHGGIIQEGEMLMNRYLITEYGVQENCRDLQTQAVQAVLDLCREDGGVVVVPRGRFYVGSLRMWSNTTLYLSEGAELFGSDDCNDYEVYEIPPHVEFRSDMEMIPQQYNYEPWDTYRRAIITAYGEKILPSSVSAIRSLTVRIAMIRTGKKATAVRMPSSSHVVKMFILKGIRQDTAETSCTRQTTAKISRCVA